MKFVGKLHILFVFVSFLFACKGSGKHPVPVVPVDITININLPSYFALTGVGGWAYVNGGSKGIVVYRQSIDVFVAYDRHSPANDATCEFPLTVNADNFLELDDSCTNAKFSLYDGSPISGSEFGLRAYATAFNGADQLRIY